ncbi:hypothetical protein B2J89_15975 [Acidovorax sp. SRB_24]|nr:hypothetical protein [Acidovorax sp. SRB_24]
MFLTLSEHLFALLSFFLKFCLTRKLLFFCAFSICIELVLLNLEHLPIFGEFFLAICESGVFIVLHRSDAIFFHSVLHKRTRFSS